MACDVTIRGGVVVDGAAVIRDGAHTQARADRVLCRGQA